MTEIDLSRAEWHKSSYSSQSGNCVEVAATCRGSWRCVTPRTPDGAKLVVSREAWRVFIRSV